MATLRGLGRRLATGDGRKGKSLETHKKETNKAIEESRKNFEKVKGKYGGRLR